MTASTKRIDGSPRSMQTRVIGLAWMLLIGVASVGHVTALRNTLTVAVSFVTLGLYLRDWRALPCKPVVVALLLWATASVLWSAAPGVTLGKLQTDLVIPLIAGAAAFYFVRQAAGLRFVVAGLVLGLVALAVLSAFAYVPRDALPANWALEQSGGIVRPLPHWYPGPGDASMFAILAIAPLMMSWTLLRGPEAGRSRIGLVVAGGLCAFVLITTNNRNAVLVAPLVLAFQWMLDRRARVVAAPTPSTSRQRVVTVSALVLALLAVAVVLEFGARERFTYLNRPLVSDSAAVELVATDTRPMIWRYYVPRGLEHPWIGFGFGRTVPGIGLRTQSDRALADVEPNAYIHAHNVLLNWWLQLGAIGLALVCAAVVTMLKAATALEKRAAPSTRARVVRNALFATCLATLARNLTDDFLVYGMATMFCVCVGAMLGEQSRLSCATRPRDPRV